MTGLVPSFILKMSRAEKHLIDLKEAISTYSDSHPYTVRSRREGKKQREVVHRLTFTAAPGPDILLAAADFVYNVRSGLDHLVAALVPSKDRDSVMFPIFFEGVWDPSVEGDDSERLKQRQRWTTVARNMHPLAVARLKGMQPTDAQLRDSESIPHLVLLNRLSNTDRHSKLPVISKALQTAVLRWETPDGKWWEAEWTGTNEALDDDAKLPVPPEATNVQVEGPPLIVIGHGNPPRYLSLVDNFEAILKAARWTVEVLAPYVWVPDAHSGITPQIRQRRDNYRLDR